jgi:uncharacterized protein (DUF697 family)
MEKQEREAIVGIALLAAFADGTKSESEHAAIRKVAEGFELGVVDLAGLLQKVMTHQLTIPKAAAALHSSEAKSIAYEVALCICESNGVKDPAEVSFLSQLSASIHQAASMVPSNSLSSDVGAHTGGHMTTVPLANPAELLDPLLLKYSVLTAALELLPQTAGALAIVPIQMKMVYDIGKRHGFDLDRSSIKDFGAALGIGAASQVLETGLRRLISGLAGTVGGSTVGSLTGGVAGTAMTFATTLALGTIADRYFASGRTIDLNTLKSDFTGLVSKAKATQSQYTDQIVAKAGELSDRVRNGELTSLLGNLLQGRF